MVHDYAVTVHKSQGQGKREVFHLMNLGMMDNASSLVAFTRLTKGTYKLYGTYGDVEQLNTRLGLERLKATVLDAGIREQRAARPPAQSIGMQAGVLQSKLDALFHEHKEGHGKFSAMRSSERKAHQLWEVFDQGRPRAAMPEVAKFSVPPLRQGLVR